MCSFAIALRSSRGKCRCRLCERPWASEGFDGRIGNWKCATLCSGRPLHGSTVSHGSTTELYMLLPLRQSLQSGCSLITSFWCDSGLGVAWHPLAGSMRWSALQLPSLHLNTLSGLGLLCRMTSSRTCFEGAEKWAQFTSSCISCSLSPPKWHLCRHPHLLSLGSSDHCSFAGPSYTGWLLQRGSTSFPMCGYYLLELLGHLPGPCPQWHVTGWFIVLIDWLYLPEALLLRQVARACCWQLPSVLWPDALRLAARQLETIIGMPVTRVRSAQQSSLAWRMWTVGRDLRLFPQCREAACVAAYCTQVVRQLAGPVRPTTPVLASLDTYGWDVDIARMYRLPPLWRLYRSPEEYYDPVMDRVSVASRSVGLHTRRQLQVTVAYLAQLAAPAEA